MTDDSNRIDALDFLRGFAVMGMVLGNVVAIGLPSAASLSPLAPGGHGPLDLASWAFDFLLVDGKFRALFAMMFGASMLLAMESAELDGRDGMAAHRRRMIWLAIFGLADHLFLWSGDMLLPLALAGLGATLLAGRDTFALVKWAIGLLAVQWAIDLTALLPLFRGHGVSLMSGGMTLLSTQEAAFYGSAYLTILQGRLSMLAGDLLHMALFVIPELLAFMALGMAMLKGGFLAAQWTAEQYRATWRRAYLTGLIPMAGLAAWVLIARDPLALAAAGSGWSVPLRLPLVVAHAALAIGIAIRFPDNPLVGAIRSLGRLALSNYLLSSLAATTLFYGYGGGLFGRLDRAALMALAVAGWGFMLLWSVAWRRWVGQGPAEWLWRRLAWRNAS